MEIISEEPNTHSPEAEDKSNGVRRIIIAISVGLFLFSLTRQCYCTTTTCSDSIMVFLLGGLGLFMSGAALAWLANPLIIFSWIHTKRKSKHSLTLSALAVLMCLSFLLFDTVLDNEAGHSNKIIEYKLGYWLWTLSAVVMLLGNIYLFILARRQHRSN